MSFGMGGQNMTEWRWIERFNDSFDTESDQNEESVSDPSYIIRISLEIILIVMGELAGMLLLSMLNQEGHQNSTSKGTLVKEVLKTSTIIQMVQRPVLLLIRMLSDFQFQMQLSSSPWLCTSMQLVIISSKMYIQFLSLIIALMRFAFIVKQDEVTTYGIKKAKRIFYGFSFLIPALITLLLDGIADQTHMTNRIYKCSYDVYINSIGADNESPDNTEFHSPIHLFIKSLVSETALVYMKCVVLGLVFLVCSNVTEAFVYFRIHRHIKK